MRKIKLSWLILLIGLILTGIPVSAQDGSEIGVIGPMSGRVTNASGNGIGGAIVTVSPIGSCFYWQGVSARTNPFGYYRLNVHYDCSLVVIAAKKGKTFTPSSMLISIDGNYENIDFVAD